MTPPVMMLPPALTPSAHARSGPILPQDVWAYHRLETLQLNAGAVRRRFLVQRDDGGKSESRASTYDTRAVIDVRELVYPGAAGDVREARGKWIYMLALERSEARWLAEVYVDTNGRWDVSSAGNPRRQPGQKVMPGFLIPGSFKELGFFISPWRLTATAMKHVEDHAREACVVLRAPYHTGLTAKDGAEMVAVPDPFAWAEEAHARNYIPQLEQWNSYLQSPERQAQHMVASTLLSILESGDAPGIGNNLRSKAAPKEWLTEYRRENEKRAEAAALAAAYLASWVDSPWHRAVEASAQQAGGAALAQTYLHYSSICDRILATLPGMRLAETLCADPARFPRTHLFPESNPSDGEGEWAGTHQWLGEVTPKSEGKKRFDVGRRYVKVASQLAFSSLVPSMIKELGKRTGSFDEVAALQSRLEKYLRSQDISTKGEAFQVIHENILRGKPPLSGVAMKTRIKRVVYETTYKRLVEAAETAEEAAKKAAEGTAKRAAGKPAQARFEKLDAALRARLERIPETPRRLVKNIAVDASVVIAAVNFAWSFSQFLARSRSGSAPSWTIDPFGRVQVSSELLTLVLKPLTELASPVAGIASTNLKGLEKARELTMADFKSLARFRAFEGSIAIVTGTIQMLDELQKIEVEGWQRDNAWSSAAHSVAAICGVASVVVGSSALISSMTGYFVLGAFAGPVGAIIGGLASVVGAAAILVASYSQRNAFEEFARLCFLGEKRPSESAPADPRIVHWWAGRALGAVKPIQEAEVLLQLLTNFAAQVDKPLGGTILVIHPGYLPQGSQFQVFLDLHYRDVGHRRTHVVLDVDSEEIAVRGDALRSQGRFAVNRDDDGRVTYIALPLDHPGSAYWPEGACYIQLRWGDATTPPHRDWLEVMEAGGSMWISSLSANYVVSGQGSELDLTFRKSPTAAQDYRIDE